MMPNYLRVMQNTYLLICDLINILKYILRCHIYFTVKFNSIPHHLTPCSHIARAHAVGYGEEGWLDGQWEVSFKKFNLLPGRLPDYLWGSEWIHASYFSGWIGNRTWGALLLSRSTSSSHLPEPSISPSHLTWVSKASGLTWHLDGASGCFRQWLHHAQCWHDICNTTGPFMTMNQEIWSHIWPIEFCHIYKISSLNGGVCISKRQKHASWWW